MEIKHLSFDEWVKYVFDHPVNKRLAWYFQPNAAMWNELSNPELTVSYMTRLFENAPLLCKRYSDAKLGQGFWFLTSNACSSHMFALLDDRVPLASRLACINSIHMLFERFFAPNCSSHLSHLDEPGVKALNAPVYMWWDIIPIGAHYADKQIDAAILDVMVRTLTLESDACRESALHGLGHWQRHYPELVTTHIDDFLENQPRLRPELRQYALSARAGCVL
jgi:hypothetical protein